ncbi:MAG: glycosyltransferase family 4 protein [Candidatus Riflebacteria bacterium]|nr:glycosyltransferase family 4 protein [Candidatus Riflebacteria bacterium]
MKVLQIPRRFAWEEWGGTETVVFQTSRFLTKFGVETKIFTSQALSKKKNELINGLEIRRFRHFYPFLGLSETSIKQMDKKGGNLFSFTLLKGLLNEPDLDLIHLHTGKRLGGIGRWVARWRHIPYVISLHGGIFDVPKSELESNIESGKTAWEWGKALGWLVGSRRVIDDSSALICVGKSEQIEASKLFPQKRVEYLPNGVDYERFLKGNGTKFRQKTGIPADAFLILTVSRIDPQKNCLFLINSFPEIIKICPKAILLLVGPITNETYYKQINERIQTLGIGGKVKIIPGLPSESVDMVDVYHSADVFVLPSIHEPFGIVILEAWAAGKPVLASKVGGIPYFLENGLDGLLFEANNGASFMDCFTKIQKNSQLLDEAYRFGDNGRKKAEFYSWENITRRLVRLYEDVINENPFRK